MNFTNIELFKNLSEWDFGGSYHDLHNDFDCIALRLESRILKLIFKERSEKPTMFSLDCENTELTRLDIEVAGLCGTLTLDNFHRGRFEAEGQLITENCGRGYFYLEFYEGPFMEFWCEQVSLNIIHNTSLEIA